MKRRPGSWGIPEHVKKAAEKRRTTGSWGVPESVRLAAEKRRAETIGRDGLTDDQRKQIAEMKGKFDPRLVETFRIQFVDWNTARTEAERREAAKTASAAALRRFVLHRDGPFTTKKENLDEWTDYQRGVKENAGPIQIDPATGKIDVRQVVEQTRKGPITMLLLPLPETADFFVSDEDHLAAVIDYGVKTLRDHSPPGGWLFSVALFGFGVLGTFGDYEPPDPDEQSQADVSWGWASSLSYSNIDKAQKDLFKKRKLALDNGPYQVGFMMLKVHT